MANRSLTLTPELGGTQQRTRLRTFQILFVILFKLIVAPVGYSMAPSHLKRGGVN